jgi:predicted enzyme related to lactoylglutathione lyase
MSLRTSPWPAGTPCWADLAVPDVPAATAFYSAVLGWAFSEPDESFGGYVIGSVEGAAAAGIGPQQQPGMPAAWTLYFAGDDADATARAVKEAGGEVLLQPGDVGPLGRMFIGADPSGAAFGVWQAGTHIGAGIVNEPGGLSWEDLRSSDPDAARAFYTAVFGFVAEPLEMAGPDYTTFSSAAGEAPLGGMGGMFGAPERTPSHWLVYFGVTDVTSAVQAARSSGGAVLAERFETPFGPMAALRDPAGAVFWITEPAATQQPDRTG